MHTDRARYPVSSDDIVVYEPCEDHNRVQIHNNMDNETATELRNIVELLVSRWELFDRLKHVRIHPDFIPWRPGSDENGLVLYGECHKGVLLARPCVTKSTTPREVEISPRHG